MYHYHLRDVLVTFDDILANLLLIFFAPQGILKCIINKNKNLRGLIAHLSSNSHNCLSLTQGNNFLPIF